MITKLTLKDLAVQTEEGEEQRMIPYGRIALEHGSDAG